MAVRSGILTNRNEQFSFVVESHGRDSQGEGGSDSKTILHPSRKQRASLDSGMVKDCNKIDPELPTVVHILEVLECLRRLQ